MLINNNKINKFIIRMSILALLFLEGCVPGPLIVTTEDVSSQKQLWYGYRLDGKYKLEVNVFLRVRNDVPTPNKTVLVAPREMTIELSNLAYSAPFSVFDYKINKSKWSDVKGIVEKGTILQCTKLIKYNPLGYGSSLYIYAKILNGPHSGEEVEISDLSLLGPERTAGFLKKPNTKLLTIQRNGEVES